MATADLRRVFFALWPEANTAWALHAAGREAQRGCGGRLTAVDTVHQTLAFLGGILAARVADAEAAAAATVGIPFEWRLDRLGYWKHNRILWAGGDCEPLAALAADLAERLRAAGFELERRPFAGHVTLLRKARCGHLPPLPAPIAWQVRDFVLVESHLDAQGARYETIGRWPLATAVH